MSLPQLQVDTERTAFISEPRQAKPSASSGERGFVSEPRQAKTSASIGVTRRTSSFSSAPPGAGPRLLAPSGTKGTNKVIKELEFDGRLRPGQVGGANAGPGGAGGAHGKAAFEDNVVTSITSIAEGLKSGSDAQKSLILFEVQQLISHSHSVAYALKTLVPVICDNVASWSHDLQICAAEALVGVQPAKLLHEQAVAVTDTAFRILRMSQDPEMFRAWGEILVVILPHVEWSQMELEHILAKLDEQHKLSAQISSSPPPLTPQTDPGAIGSVGAIGLVPIGIERASLPGYSASDLAQKLTARIIGPIAVAASPDLTKNVLLTRALDLTKESDVEVRGMVVESMAFIGAAVDIDTVERRIWPSLAGLVRDPNARLHAATLRTISRIAAAHRKSTPRAKFFTDLLPPVFVRECQYLRKQAQADQRLVDDDTYLLIEINAEIFGELFYSCHKFLSDDSTRKDAFRAFQAMATCNGPVVRRHCAFNIPGIALSMIKRCRQDIATIVEFLSRDTDAETRWNLAAGMHETAKILCGDDTIDNLFKAINALLHDESPLVRMNVLQNLDNLLGILTAHNPVKAMRKLETVFQNLQLLSEGNWRTQQLLAKQLRLVTPLVPPQCIRANVLPLLYQLTDESSYTVRKASMAAVAVCLRYLPDTNEREEVMENFRLEWGRGTVFWMRIGFIDSAEAAVETYSRILFRDTFALELLRLVNDPVPNVRVRAAQLIHKIAPACHQMEEFQMALAALKQDVDVDVCYTVSNVEEKINDEVEAGKKSFEQDMTREAEEQNLYTKHLQLKAEVNKKRAGVKHKTNALFEALSPRGTPGGEYSFAGGDLGKSKSPRRLPRGSTFTNGPGGGGSSSGGSSLPRGSTFTGSNGLAGSLHSGGGPGSSSGAEDLSSMLNEIPATHGTGSRLPRAASVSARIGRKTAPQMTSSVRPQKLKNSSLLGGATGAASSPTSVRNSSSMSQFSMQGIDSDERAQSIRGSAVKGLMGKMSARNKR